MGNLIGIVGPPGTGKSTSLMNLPSEETFYFDADGKGLNWKGWRNKYNIENKNYAKSSFPQVALRTLAKINKDYPNIKYFVVDTVNNLMVSDEMRRVKEKGYDKWADLASCVWDLVDMPSQCRGDLTVILIFHSQMETDDFGYKHSRIKTNGRKTEKNDIDSKFNWLLGSAKIDGKYMLSTTCHDDTCRTPMDAFSEEYIPNDIMKVLEVMKEY